MEIQRSDGRVPGLDLVKLLGLFLVIYYHIVWQYPPDIVSSGNVLHYVIIYAQTFLAVCVPLFFTASGALSLSRPVDLRKNTLRALHLLGITLFWIMICLLTILTLRGERVGMGTFLSLAKSLKIGYIQHLWYLPCFLFLTLMIPVLSALKVSNRRIYRYFILMIAVFSFGDLFLNNCEYVLRWMLGKTGYTGYRYFFWKVDFFQYHYWYMFVYFALGAFLMEHQGAVRKPLLGVGILLGMAGLLFMTVVYTRVQGTMPDYVFANYSSVFTLLMTVCVFLLLIDVKPPVWLGKIACSVAKCSLGIYIIHWLVWEAFVQLIPEVMKNIAFGVPMTLMIGGISWAITALGLKIPGIRNLFTAAPEWIRRRCR